MKTTEVCLKNAENLKNCILGGIFVIFGEIFDNFLGNFPPIFQGRGMEVNMFCEEKKLPP